MRLEQMGGSVRNSTTSWRINEERKMSAKVMMEKMPTEQLSELLSYYLTVSKIDLLRRVG